jgi:16S rRNA (guanine1207-N2)-methyltransferase
MDLFQADRLREALRVRGCDASVVPRADLWDLADAPPPGFEADGPAGGIQTIVYPAPRGGERALKLDIIEQAYHALQPGGTLVVLSPYEKDDFFPSAMKKVFGKVHAPMQAENAVLWSVRTGDKPRRRHEMSYHVRIDDETSLSFLSRPGVFGYGFFDDGARALSEVMEARPGDRVLDLGCGVGTVGILAARKVGADGAETFADSNVRAIALVQHNTRVLAPTRCDIVASHRLDDWPDGSFDVVLANPPYYAQGEILAHFVARGSALLRPGGSLYLVTKQVELALGVVQEHLGEPEMFEHRGYVVFRASKSE